jgi:hypothetical protein
MKYFALICVFALAAACGSKNEPTTFVPPPSGGASSVAGASGHAGRSGTGGKGGAGTGGEAGDTAGGDAGDTGGTLAPTVHITSPVAVTDPNTGTVVTTNPVQVLCDVTASTAQGATIDTQTVKIQAFDADGVATTVSATTSTQNPNDPNEYGATASLVGIGNGPISFKCSVSDKSTPPKISSDTVETFFDRGPTITVASPLPNSSFSLKKEVLFKFSVTAAPLTTKDKLGAVDMTAGKVALLVDDQPISLTAAQDSSDPTTYSVNVKLNDPVQFPKTPSGTVPVVITAWNTRGVEAKLPYTVDIDGTPPVIQIVSPITGQVVGGHVTLEFIVTDTESGIDPNSVTVSLNHMAPVVYDPTPLSGWSLGTDGKTFDYGFESNSAEIGGAVQVHVEIGASDKAANASSGATEDLYLDNQPPVVDLDPPILQERKPLSSATPPYICSSPFDPLGDSPNDQEVVPSAGIYRALVWDETNEVDGQTVLHLAGTNQASVVLYAQSDSATPLLVARHNTSTLCDDLNTDAVAKPPLENLVPIAPTGVSFFNPGAPAIAGVCASGTDSTPPKGLCAGNSSDLTRVIDHAVVGTTEPVIYAIKATNAAECTGQNWSLVDAGLPNGWICLAALATDNVGNLGISPPLRVCLNSTLPGKVTPACAISSTVPPTCTDGCTPPPHFGVKVLNLPQ